LKASLNTPARSADNGLEVSGPGLLMIACGA
jgi:hypothetical protein